MQGTLELQKLKVHQFIPSQVIKDNASWTSNCLDTAGLDGVMVLFAIGDIDANMTALKVQEADAITNATTLTSGTDISGADFSVSPLTLPTAADSDNECVAVYIPIVGTRKRYLNIVATAGNGAAGTYATCYGICTPKIVPSTATGRNLEQQAIIAG